MNIHEFQAKELLRKYGVATTVGRECRTADEAAEAHTALGTPVTVVKAQIHAGGRGKAGGVKVVKSADEAREAAANDHNVSFAQTASTRLRTAPRRPRRSAAVAPVPPPAARGGLWRRALLAPATAP